MKIKPIKIKTPKGERLIGPGQPVFIVAEMSGNHNGDIRRAYKIIDAAAAAGVDAIKLQTYTPDTMTIDCNKKYFVVQGDLWGGQSLYDLYKTAYTPWAWQPKLKKYAEKKGLVCFSTPFDETAVDFLEKMKVQLYKVASFEVVDIPLLERIGQTKKPVFMSRGMASPEELKLALKTLKKFGCPQVIVLQCISAYPAKPEQMNLATIPDLQKRLKAPVGLSDHTLSNNVSISAVALGACVIEKHFTLKRSDGGPDAAFSFEPKELKNLVAAVKEIRVAVGRPFYGGQNEKAMRLYRRSLFAVEDIKKEEKLTKKNVRSIRPSNGLPPKYFCKILGRIAKRDIEKGTPLSWNLMK
jgi:pseudaminic acid synthase